MINLNTVLFGTDAELFLRTITKQPIPVCGMVGGTKDKPLPLTNLGEGFAVQEDNAAVEFNVPPNHSIQKFAESISDAKYHILHRMLPKSVYLDMENASLIFPEPYLRIPEMNVFGCEPDYNAFTLQTNDTPRPPVPGFRSASAHVHLGWKNVDGSEPTDEDRLEMIRLADTFVTLYHAQKENESDKKRRQLYGRAGAFRPKSYGVEHRVLSNSWIRERVSVLEVTQQYLLAFLALNNGITVETGDYDNIQKAINNGAKVTQSAIYKKYDRLLWGKLGNNFDWDHFRKGFQ